MADPMVPQPLDSQIGNERAGYGVCDIDRPLPGKFASKDWLPLWSCGAVESRPTLDDNSMRKQITRSQAR